LRHHHLTFIMKNILLLVLFLGLISCKQDATKDKSATEPSGTSLVDPSVPTDPSKLTITDPCKLLTAEDVKNIFAIPAAAINIKNADQKDNKQVRSCFVQWDDKDTPNAGILVMIQTNSMFTDAPDYISRFVDSKLTTGEAVMGGDEKPMLFKQFKAGSMGKGAYNFNQARFYWNYKNDYLFMLAFNLNTLSEPKMVDAAEKLIDKINTNFMSTR
jgi:hypothetical protein